LVMNTQLFVETIACVAAVVVAALTYWFTKLKERDADWRKWKYEQYKEFLTALSENVGPPNRETHRAFLRACNTLNLIGSRGVLVSLQSLITSMNADNPRRENNAWISKLIWEIRTDLKIPGTPGAEDFTARLWFHEPRGSRDGQPAKNS
jgi:hypothetical protein